MSNNNIKLQSLTYVSTLSSFSIFLHQYWHYLVYTGASQFSLKESRVAQYCTTFLKNGLEMIMAVGVKRQFCHLLYSLSGRSCVCTMHVCNPLFNALQLQLNVQESSVSNSMGISDIHIWIHKFCTDTFVQYNFHKSFCMNKMSKRC